MEDNKAVYNQRFLELEFRALRASLMNYKESGRFDRWTRIIDYVTLLIAVGGIAAGIVLLYLEMYIKGAVTLGATLPTSGLMLMLTRWRSQLLPFATRAQSHVNAGAEWTRIRRLAKLYRLQLQTATPDLDKLESQYKELLSAHKDASLCTVIRATAYKEYNKVPHIFKEYKKRQDQTKEYEKLLSAFERVGYNEPDEKSKQGCFRNPFPSSGSTEETEMTLLVKKASRAAPETEPTQLD